MRHAATAFAILALGCASEPAPTASSVINAHMPAITQARGLQDLAPPTGRPGSRIQALLNLWGGGARTLDIRPPGAVAAIAWQSNVAGQVVGVSFDEGSSAGSAYLYRAGEWTNLTPPGAVDAMAHEINELGQVVIVAFMEDGTGSVFLWTPVFPWASRGTFTQIVNATGSSIGADLNDHGQVSGTIVDAEGNARAFLWTPSAWDRTRGTRVDLSTPAGAIGAHLNEYGQVAGVYRDSESFELRFFLWTPSRANGMSGTTTELGAAPDDTFMGNPLFGDALTELGQVLIETPIAEAPGTWQVAVWTPGWLNAPVGRARAITEAKGTAMGFSINDVGQVTGAVVDLESFSFSGFLHTPGRARTDLGPVVPYALNLLGTVGGARTDEETGITRGFVWKAGTFTAVSTGDDFEGTVFAVSTWGDATGTSFANGTQQALFYTAR